MQTDYVQVEHYFSCKPLHSFITNPHVTSSQPALSTLYTQPSTYYISLLDLKFTHLEYVYVSKKDTCKVFTNLGDGVIHIISKLMPMIFISVSKTETVVNRLGNRHYFAKTKAPSIRTQGSCFPPSLEVFDFFSSNLLEPSHRNFSFLLSSAFLYAAYPFNIRQFSINATGLPYNIPMTVLSTQDGDAIFLRHVIHSEKYLLTHISISCKIKTVNASCSKYSKSSLSRLLQSAKETVTIAPSDIHKPISTTDSEMFQLQRAI